MNVSKVDGLLAEMRAAMVAAQGGGLPRLATLARQQRRGRFRQRTEISLDSVSQAQNQATSMQNAFVMGDDKVS